MLSIYECARGRGGACQGWRLIDGYGKKNESKSKL
jgi:hypothetical protein